MPEAVVNTSPLQYLHQIRRLELLRDMYSPVLVPSAVVRELDVGRRQGVDLPDVASLGWLTVIDTSSLAVLALAVHLGSGEREVIALASARSALAVLDDRAARDHAELLGVKTTGTLGLLVRAKAELRIELVGDEVAKLRQCGFFLDSRTEAAVLAKAGEGSH